ncbi:Sucrose nonfermenting 4-like protein [Glycine max]|nr:Sucrose nonfermenting 4-like protein [Glycine max]KAH1243659.1 Sucrose nonfermenting 4-like protein [Glycine max]
MFSPSMDSARDASGVAGTVLIPMRFVWPYGGRSVYLSGSFTRWSELLQMSPVEGCPTVFQVIHSLIPGHHQYKFFVDGEWRHDDHQPCVSGEYGIVNTVLLATDPNIVPVLTPEIVSGSNMDVDNEAFRCMVRLTDSTLNNVLLPRISDVDIQTSRQRISAFLSMSTAYELLPESGKVVTLDVDLPVKQAFHILHEQGIPVAPLWDICKGQFVGVLSALDFILIIRECEFSRSHPKSTMAPREHHACEQWMATAMATDGSGNTLLGNHGSNLTEEELETHTISAWKGGKYFRNCSSSLPILQLPICAIPVGTWVPKIGESNRRPLAMLRPNASLTSALNLLVQAQVSSIPIVDDSDSLLDIYCRSDITALAKDRTYTHINLDEMTALQLGQDSYNTYELRSQRCQMCLRTDSLHKVMERLANPGVRRLVIVEAGSKRVEGIIALSDIFNFFLGYNS